MSEQMGQKEAVVKITQEVLGDRFQPGMNVSSVLTKDDRKEIKRRVCTGIIQCHIKYSKTTYVVGDLLKYVNGMVDNHIRKAKELNGGIQYSAQNFTAARGRRDPQLANLKRLKNNYSAKSPEYVKVQKAIMKREGELAVARSTLKAKNRVKS